MSDTTQAASDAVNAAPFAANLRGMPGLTERDAGLLEQAASLLEALHDDQHRRGNSSAAVAAACSSDAVRRLALQLLRAAPPAPQGEKDDWGLRPVEPGALASSIASLEAWEERADGELLTQDESESVLLVLHQLKWLRAAGAGAPAVPADAFDSVRVLLRVAKNQATKASMAHAIGVVQAEVEKAAARIAATPPQEHATQLAGGAHYSLDADPDGIRARAADAITGALAIGAQGGEAPPAGHWLTPFWMAARFEACQLNALREVMNALTDPAQETAPALEAPAAPVAPDDWKLMPVVMTEAMDKAMRAAWTEACTGSSPTPYTHRLYAAALAAAPQAPAAPGYTPPPGYRLQPISEYDAMCAALAAPAAPALDAREVETEVVGAMHRGAKGAKFSECIECGAMAEQLAKPCPAYMNEAAATFAAIAAQAKGGDAA